MSTATAPRLLTPEVLSRLDSMELRARLIVEGFITGLHKSPYHGFSVEFAEHRPYNAGDELRHVDWKVYAKSDRYYVKQYEEETNLVCQLIVDVSESMDFGTGDVRKQDYALTLAAALAYLVVKQNDAVGLVLFDDAVRDVVQAGSSQGQLRRIFALLEEARPGGETDVGNVLARVSERVRKRGLVVLISDLVGPVEEVLAGLRRLRSRGHDVIVLHVVDPAETTFPFEQLTLFEGLEAYPDLLADPKALREAYVAGVEEFMSTLRAGCLAERIDLVEMNTETPLDVALSSYLAKRAMTRRRGRAGRA